MPTKKFKSDKFKKNRGGYSKWLQLSCEKCKTKLFTYQKDGSGLLKRLYFDRITTSSLVKKEQLICKKCKTVIGVPIIYKKENQPAYRLFAGAVEKEAIKK